MGKKKNRTQVTGIINTVAIALIPLLLAVIGWLIVALYEELKEDIHGTNASLQRNTMEVFQLRTDFIRVHPEVGRAAYVASTMSRSDVLTLDQARRVYEVLTSDKVTEYPEILPDHLRNVLSKTEELNERQVDVVTSAYFDFDPQDADSSEIYVVYEGLAAIRPTLFVFDERVMPSTAQYSRLSTMFAIIFVVLLIAIVVVVAGRAGKSSNGDRIEETE